jgi:hypothetical protein
VLTDEAFKTELSAARSELFQAAMNRVQGLTVKAVDTLEELLGVAQYRAFDWEPLGPC